MKKDCEIIDLTSDDDADEAKPARTQEQESRPQKHEPGEWEKYTSILRKKMRANASYQPPGKSNQATGFTTALKVYKREERPSTANYKDSEPIVLDADEGGGEYKCPVVIARELAGCLKDHQKEGIKFLYASTFKSLEYINGKGHGCILAHRMGLGKTLQVIAFLHSVLTNAKIARRVRKVLIVLPKNVIINWRDEFDKWLNKRGLNSIRVFCIGINESAAKGESSLDGRLKALKRWNEHSGPSALLISYELFRILTVKPMGKGEAKKRKMYPHLDELYRQFQALLQDPGADLVICDEGHKLKSPNPNSRTIIVKAMEKIKTCRRIALTGTPLQNNMAEYYFLVEFVNRGFLGSYTYYKDKFADPIERGKVKDAEAADVREMYKMASILFRKLESIVHYRDYKCLVHGLPEKQEYILRIRLTPVQIELMELWKRLQEEAAEKRKQQNAPPKRDSAIVKFYIFNRICAHPYLLFEKDQGEDSDGYHDGGRPFFSDDDDGEERNLVCDLPSKWYEHLIDERMREDFLGQSNKLAVVINLIKETEARGEKMLLFTLSLETLRLIKRMLETMAPSWFSHGHNRRRSARKWGWTAAQDFDIICGSVSAEKRYEIQQRFNEPGNPQLRLLLISTRAGSLGTNLVAANRVVIFDANWNPSHDNQALFRTYRYGQERPVYVYRLCHAGVFEEAVYSRGVLKDSIAARAVEGATIKRHFYARETALERFDKQADVMPIDEDPEIEMLQRHTNVGEHERPKDDLLAEVLQTSGSLIEKWEPHDSLFDEFGPEKLSEEERTAAWDEYERNRQAEEKKSQGRKNIRRKPPQGPVYSVGDDEDDDDDDDGDGKDFSNQHDGYEDGDPDPDQDGDEGDPDQDGDEGGSDEDVHVC